MTGGWITKTGRSRWQGQAGLDLAAVPAAWRGALRLKDYRRWAGGGMTWLHAAGRCGVARVRICASACGEAR